MIVQPATTKEMIPMPFDALESLHEGLAATRGRLGIIVVSSTNQLLFINQRATELMGRLDSTCRALSGPAAIPTCLVDVTQDLCAIQTSAMANGSPRLHQINRLVGATSFPVLVKGFVLDSDKRDRRIVLVLSQPASAVVS